MTARETLESCRSMAQECAKIAELIELAERRIPMGPSASIAVTLRDTPRGGNDNAAAAIAQVDGLEQWYRRDHAGLVTLVDQVEDILSGLRKQDFRKVLRMYYVDALTDVEVAQAMGFLCRETACRKRMDALQDI